jgi:hypothetical protein
MKTVDFGSVPFFVTLYRVSDISALIFQDPVCDKSRMCSDIVGELLRHSNRLMIKYILIL